MIVICATLALALGIANSEAQPRLVDRLETIRARVLGLEEELLDSLKAQKHAKDQLQKIRTLILLQTEERELSRKRLSELEQVVGELESRKVILQERIKVEEAKISQRLRDIDRSRREEPKTLHLPEREKIEAPRRRVLANLVERSLKEIEALKADLMDAEQLEARIQEERQQLEYLYQDLREKESVLELNRQIQADMIRKNHIERVAQLDDYRKLKNSQSQVEQLITQFNARQELKKTEEVERAASVAIAQGVFAKLKGKLPLPTGGKIVSGFGRTFDAKTRLHVFKKGIEIATGKKVPVHAVSAGKVVYSGELPGYGRVAIVDHGDHFYSLCANLGGLLRKVGDAVVAGDPLGISDDAGTPVYFEIRARNVAVNPLQWISN